MDDFTNKELINTYKKNGFIVKTYKPIMPKEERSYKNSQIKYDVMNIIKELNLYKNMDKI